MCGIAASFDTDTLRNLIDLNAYRGSQSWSFALYDTDFSTIEVNRGKGHINMNDVYVPKGYYGIAHIQAPTSTITEDTIHPAEWKGNMLWHNGILKPSTIESLQVATKSDSVWDTFLLCKYLSTVHFSPQDIDGSFACVFYENPYLYFFRNQISPLFIDKKWNLSSTKFPMSKIVQPNMMFGLDFSCKTIHPIAAFNTVDCPYDI